MPVQPGVWGIDLGQCALKAIRMEQIDGQVTATAFDYVEHPKILSQPDADPDQLTREALEKFLSRNTLKGDLVAISIPGQSGLARFVKLPPVEEKKIGDIVRFEAKQQIPFNLEEVVWDYQKLSSGVVTDGFAMETEIGLFAIKRDTVNRYLQHFKDVNVEVQVVQMAPLALCNYVSYDLLQKAADSAGPDEVGGKKKCVVALDIGADNTNLVITDGARIIWQRPIPLGGNHFTRALTKDMKLTFAKAEHLKRNATKSPELKQILSSLKPVLNDFVGEVQRSLGYFTNTHRDASIQYMMGLGSAFRLPGLQKFLSEKLQLDVRKLQKLDRLAGDEVVTAPLYTENVLSFAVAYGLALQGLHAARLHTNLLPQEIRVERMIRAKKPWAVTAAASLLIGTAVLAIGYNRQYTAVAAPEVKAKMKGVDDVVARAGKFESEVKNVKDLIDKHKAAVKSIILGQEERMNWIQFNNFVNRALPKPDGSNLNTVPIAEDPQKRSAKQVFWKYDAQQAWLRFQAQQKGTAKGQEKIEEEQWRDDLVQANIESMYCVYTPNLSGFLNALKTDAMLNTMSEKDKKNTLEGKKGWVVELRGYTYNRYGYRFVVNAVVDNLARTPVHVLTLSKKIEAESAPAGSGQATADASKAAPPTTVAKADQTPAAPATPPAAAAAAAPGAAATPGTPVAADAAKDDYNQVSHVVLYKYLSNQHFDPASFELISSRVVDGLVGGGGGGALPGGVGGTGKDMQGAMSGGGGGMGMGGGGTASAAGVSWTPLGSDGVGGGGGGVGMGPGGKPGNAPSMGQGGGMTVGTKQLQMPGGAMGGMAGMGGFGQNPGGRGMFGIPGSGNMGLPGMGDTQPEETKKKKGVHTRTEFIIFFVWQEPTPSDEYLPPEDTAAPTGGAAGGMGMGGMNTGGAAK